MNLRRHLGAALLSTSLLCPAFAASPVEAVLGTGRVSYFYGPDHPSDSRGLGAAVRRSQFAEKAAQLTATNLYLRRDLQIGFEACGRANAFFDPRRSAIVICYEFVEMAGRIAQTDLQRNPVPRDQFIQILDGVMWSIFLHELGHAVIAINRVPITGREEDVADQFSAWFSLNFMASERMPPLVAGVWMWKRMSMDRSFHNLSEEDRRRVLADEHSLDAQRAYNLSCLIIGALPQQAQYLAERLEVPLERAQRCPGEYAQMDRAMRAAFGKFIRGQQIR